MLQTFPVTHPIVDQYQAAMHRATSLPNSEGQEYDQVDSEASSSVASSPVVMSVGLPSEAIGTNIPFGPNRSSPSAQSDVHTREDEDLEGVISLIRYELVLDKTTESNALPFVLQGYAAWMHRLAFDPLKMTGIARDFVFNHFEDGDQSRWIIALMANVGSRIGSVELVEGQHNPMLSTLQIAVRRRIGAVNSLQNPEIVDLVKALDCVVETMVIHFYTSPVEMAMVLRHEAAPIFRQLCPEPPNSPINLHALLQHPLRCLWHYAEMDIIFSVVSDMPTLFRYQVVTVGNQSFNPYQSASAIQNDNIVQWLHGVPNQLIFFFARIKTMQHDGVPPNGETVAILEREIREFPSFTGPSSEPFLTIMRSVVQECWRQVAYIYLYMAVCRDPSDTPRVKEAFKRYMRLLNSTKPGRLPDQFLILTILLICPAAQRQRDRQTLKQRVLRLYGHDRVHVSTAFVIYTIEDYWARTDAEGRPVVWSDIAVSRKRILGV